MWLKNLLVKSPDKASYLAILTLLILIRLGFSSPHKTLTWDVFGYYVYLPAIFIYHDPFPQDLSVYHEANEQYQLTGTFYQFVKGPLNQYIFRYASGPAVLNLPFFLAGHALANKLGYKADGFSKPYQYAWILGALFYTAWGLYLLMLILRRFFSPQYTALLLLLLTLATNFINIATLANPLSHSFLFFLHAAFLYQLFKWQSKVTYAQALSSGLIAGLIAISRPNEVLVVMLAAMWQLNKPYLSNRIHFFKTNIWPIACFAAGGFISALPQLVYWKMASGSWLYYSYQDAGVGFDFLNPHTIPFLFSFRKGWFVYTPIMLFCVVGFYQLWKQQKPLFIAFLFFLIPHIYVISSWSEWWYAGGCYSSRSMVSVYALLTLVLGFGLKPFLKYKFSWLWIVFLCYLNLFQFWQFSNRIIDGERMTFQYYCRIFGKTKMNPADQKYLLVHRQADAYESMPQEAEHLSKAVLFSSPDTNGVWMNLNEKSTFTPAFEKAYREICPGEYSWLRCEAEIWIPHNYSEEKPLLVCHFEYKNQLYKYVASENQINSLQPGRWNRIKLDYMTPKPRRKTDKFKTYIWHRGKQDILVRKVKVTVFYGPKAPF